MRVFLWAFFTLSVVSCASVPRKTVDTVEIKSVLLRHMETWQFMRIGEYMTGKEMTGDRVILRSNPSIRDGFYFILILDEKLKRLPQDTVVEGEFFTPLSLDVQKHSFKLPDKRSGTREIFIGLTGKDWPYGKERVPAAWRFTIKNVEGKILGRKKSYLWSL